MTSNDTSRTGDFKALLRALGVRGSDVISLGTIAHRIDEDGREDDRYHGRAYRAKDAVRIADGWSGRDGYFSVSVLSDDVLQSKRRRVSDVVGVRALYADLDFKAGGLETMDEARDVVKRLSKILGTPPAAVVLSGGGVQPYFRLDRQASGDLTTEFVAGEDGNEARRAVGALYRRWGRLVGSVIDTVTNGRVSKADTVWDLARILRVPGTSNMKYDPVRAVELARVNDDARAVSLDRVKEICDEFGIAELDSDSEVLGQVVSVPDEWSWAAPGDECRYVVSMTEGWKTANPPARHPWLFGQATRIAAARRLGYVTEAQWDDALDVLWTRFEELLDRPGDARGVQSGDREWLSFGVRKASAMDVDRAVSEMGGLEDDGHRHGDSDDPFAAGASCVKPKPPLSTTRIDGGERSSRRESRSSAAADSIEDDDDVHGEFAGGRNSTKSSDTSTSSAPATPEAKDAGVKDVDVPIDLDAWVQKGRGIGTFTDRWLGEAFAYQVCRDRFCFASGLGWLRWTGQRWAPCPDEAIKAAVGQWAREQVVKLAQKDMIDSPVYEGWKKVLADRVQSSIVSQAKGITLRDGSAFDVDPDVLNTPDGLVDLRTGEVTTHDASMMVTKMAEGSYRPGLVHQDWETALAALPDAETREYFQSRIGQAITGHRSPDGVNMILQGGGENGKGALVSDGIVPAFGDYAAPASEKLITGSANDHSEEKADLRGRRLVVAEELTEDRVLNVTAIKRISDVAQIRARHVYQKNMSFRTTHSLIATSNYRPVVNETDWGTWRRLELWYFPYTFRKLLSDVRRDTDRLGDPELKHRIETNFGGVYDAIVTWAIEGARRWYDKGAGVLVPSPWVVKYTQEWQQSADRIAGFWSERLVSTEDEKPDAKGAVPKWCIFWADLLEAFNDWLKANGHNAWTKETFQQRFGAHRETSRHGVELKRTVNPKEQQSPEHRLDRYDRAVSSPARLPKQVRVWTGVRFRTVKDDVADEVTDRGWEVIDGEGDEGIGDDTAVDAHEDDEGAQEVNPFT